MPPVRRLTAILAADVAGYSRLMGADEEGTHERLKAHLGELVYPKIAEHHGRVVKNTGDGFLVEFASVVDAVRCAAEVQRGMAERTVSTPPEKRIKFRVGINLGDVIAEDEDIFGDGVNVAARLQALAEPGEICVSRFVRDQVRDRVNYTFKDLGEQQVKNIARPVRVYALRLEVGNALPTRASPARPSMRSRTTIAAIATAAFVVVACVGWWLWPAPAFFFGTGKPGEQATPSSPPIPCGLVTPCPPHGVEVIAHAPSPTPQVLGATRPQPAPLVALRLSIVVLPFANLSNDPDQQYLADGITEDLTTDLSRIADMLVISRNTAFTYRNKPIDAKQIGRELGVRYLLEGSVQRSGTQVRINAQLIDAETDAHLWAERFDRDMGDLFALQNEITSRIAITLNTELLVAEAARLPEQADALDFVLRGRAVALRPSTRASFAEAIGYFERALALDPGSVEAQSLLASTLAGRAMEGMTDTRASDIARAERLAQQALASAPRNPLVHQAKGQVLRAQNRCREAIPEFETVIALNNNALGAVSFLADCKLHIGPIEEVIPLVDRAIRLSPRDPGIGNMYGRIAVAHLLQSRLDDAIIWSEKARQANPARAFPHSALAAAYALKGETERPATELAEAQSLDYDFYRSLAPLRARYSEVPEILALFDATYGAGLRKAGMPEE